MALSTQDVADVLNAASIDTPQKFAAFVSSAVKPLQRAALQDQIDAENKAFAASQATHNATLTTLQSQLNAV